MIAPVVAVAAAAAGQVVAPAPPTVGVLDRVVRDAAAQRRLGPRRVERDGALEDLVEALEVLGSVDELRDRARLLAVHAGRHVDEHQRRARGRARDRRARWRSIRPATCRRRVGRRARARGLRSRARPRSRPASTRDRAGATSGRGRAGRARRADGRGRAPRCPRCARSALRRGSSTSSGELAPQTSALTDWSAPTSTATRRTSGVPRQGMSELLGILVEQGELVVGHGR